MDKTQILLIIAAILVVVCLGVSAYHVGTDDDLPVDKVNTELEVGSYYTIHKYANTESVQITENKTTRAFISTLYDEIGVTPSGTRDITYKGVNHTCDIYTMEVSGGSLTFCKDPTDGINYAWGMSMTQMDYDFVLRDTSIDLTVDEHDVVLKENDFIDYDCTITTQGVELKTDYNYVAKNVVPAVNPFDYRLDIYVYNKSTTDNDIKEEVTEVVNDEKVRRNGGAGSITKVQFRSDLRMDDFRTYHEKEHHETLAFSDEQHKTVKTGLGLREVTVQTIHSEWGYHVDKYTITYGKDGLIYSYVLDSVEYHKEVPRLAIDGSNQLFIEKIGASEPTTSHIELTFVESNLVNA